MAERTKLNGTSVKLNSTETSKDALGESVSEIVVFFQTFAITDVMYYFLVHAHKHTTHRAIVFFQILKHPPPLLCPSYNDVITIATWCSEPS